MYTQHKINAIISIIISLHLGELLHPGFAVPVHLRELLADPREFTKGGLVKGGFSNNDVTITRKLLNPSLLNPPL